MSNTQPRHNSRIAVLGMTGILGTGLSLLLMVGPNPDPEGMVRGLLLAVLPVPGYVSLALWIERFEAEPPWMLTLAVFVSLLLNTLVAAITESILAHSLWDAASFGERFLPVYVGVMVPLFLGVLWMIRAYLRTELRAGRLYPAEYTELCSVRARQLTALRAWWDGGWRAWRQRRGRQRLWSELAFRQWRHYRGLVSRQREGELHRQLNSSGVT